MSRSKRFRVLHVTSDENREFARRNVNARVKNEPLRRHEPETFHKVKVTVVPFKTKAECLECGFNINPRREFQIVVFDAESHGRITELDCAKRDEKLILLLIKDIRNGLVDRSCL